MMGRSRDPSRFFLQCWLEKEGDSRVVVYFNNKVTECMLLA